MNSKYSTIEELLSDSKIKLLIIVSDIRSAYNVGAIFRTADGAGGTGIILTGYSPTPENPKVAKTALGSDYQVPWIQLELDQVLQQENVEHVGLEITPKAVDLFAWQPDNTKKIFLYIGNEVTGLTSELMTRLDKFVKLPMNGSKNSLNVAEATSIAIYELLRKRR